MVTLTPQVVLPATSGESNHAVSTSLTIPKPVGVQNGDLLVAALRCGSSVQTSDYTLSGWTRRGAPFAPSSAGTRVTGIYTHYVTDAASEPSTYVFALAGNAFARQSGLMFIVRPAEGAEPWGGEPTLFEAMNATSGPPMQISPYAAAEGAMQFVVAGGEITSPNPIGWTTEGLTTVGVHGSLTDQSVSNTTRSVIAVGSAPVDGTSAGGSAHRVTMTGASGTAPLGFSVAGSPATEEVEPGEIIPRFSTVSQLLGSKGGTVMHRAPTGYAESTKATYEAGYALGFSAFEMSLAFTSDLVPFGHGGQYLDPQALGTSTTTLNPNEMTWAQVQGHQNIVGSNAPQPFYALGDFLTDFVDSGRGIALVDPKWGFSDATKVAAMLDICDAHGGPAKILIKFDSPTSNTVLTLAAQARGYTTINYWSADQASLPAQQGAWDVLGAAYDAGPAMWAALKSYGKPVWAAIVPNQAALDAAVVNTGADFYVVRSLAVNPVGPRLLRFIHWDGTTETDLSPFEWLDGAESALTVEES